MRTFRSLCVAICASLPTQVVMIDGHLGVIVLFNHVGQKTLLLASHMFKSLEKVNDDLYLDCVANIMLVWRENVLGIDGMLSTVVIGSYVLKLMEKRGRGHNGLAALVGYDSHSARMLFASDNSSFVMSILLICGEEQELSRNALADTRGPWEDGLSFTPAFGNHRQTSRISPSASHAPILTESPSNPPNQALPAEKPWLCAPLAISPLKDIDLGPPRMSKEHLPVPFTGHELMGLFPPASPLTIFASSTSSYFRREERAFFAQIDKELEGMSVGADGQGDASQLSNSLEYRDGVAQVQASRTLNTVPSSSLPPGDSYRERHGNVARQAQTSGSRETNTTETNSAPRTRLPVSQVLTNLPPQQPSQPPAMSITYSLFPPHPNNTAKPRSPSTGTTVASASASEPLVLPSDHVSLPLPSPLPQIDARPSTSLRFLVVRTALGIRA
ncbi:hypothetical protein NM688_g2229 [Phlebia brevispora]|uniref:Uncharacterized protein n=1 Tax=Phlebia brevispora TaxID=194682 RepID=A0ACC1T9G4_9APHY|nr:hypothetical protein NM688_g2229 [Phlebia brevispora]